MVLTVHNYDGVIKVTWDDTGQESVNWIYASNVVDLTRVEQSAMDFKSNASSPRAVGGRVAAATARSATAPLAVGDACWRKVDTVCKPAQCCGAMLLQWLISATASSV